MHLGIEGLDGAGKSTLVSALIKKLQGLGVNVFQTSEPGNKNQDASMVLRDLILNKKYENDIDDVSRENILAQCRYIQYRKTKSYLKKNYWVIQDRGWLSGITYSQANGMSEELFDKINKHFNPHYQEMFDSIIYLNNNKNISTLKDAQNAKIEFKDGDIIESRGEAFQEKVKQAFEKYKNHPKVKVVDMYEGDKRLSPEELADKILALFQKTIVFIMGNSGCGKSTLEQALLLDNKYQKIISYTTRPIDTEGRQEVDGVHYHFISTEEFNRLENNNFFLQTTKFGDNYYASSRESYFKGGDYITLVVTPDKIKDVKEQCSNLDFKFKTIFFDISFDKIKENLKNNDLSDEEIKKRFDRGDLKDSFIKEGIVSDYTVKDHELNSELPSIIKKVIEL